jgi:hypothetical protein
MPGISLFCPHILSRRFTKDTLSNSYHGTEKRLQFKIYGYIYVAAIKKIILPNERLRNPVHY